MFRLDDRVAFVTGAASGIGAATATTFAEAGADVALVYFAGDPYPVNSMGADGLAAFAERVPAGRNGRPEDVDALYTYLASDEASYLTGQVLLIDGGASLSLGY